MTAGMKIKAFLCLAAAALTLTGCGGSLKNMNIHPSDRGLLAAIREHHGAGFTDNGYEVALLNPAGTLRSGSALSLGFQVWNPSGQRSAVFTEDMTKLMHLIVVSRDLSFFSHVHPRHLGQGEFNVDFEFPFGGDYLFIHEFVPEKAGHTVYRQRVSVAGDRPEAQSLKADPSFTKEIGGVRASVSFIPDLREIEPGQMAMIRFELRGADSGQLLEPEPYLGTSGHCVILDADGGRFLHAHAAEEMSSPSGIMFHTEFPAPGLYKMWGQFQHKNKLIIVPFVVQID